MRTRLLSFVLPWLVSTAAFGATCKDSTARTIPIRAAEKAEYATVRDAKNWPNPSVVANRGGFTLTVSTLPNPRRDLTFDETLTEIDQQDCAAWKFGAVILLGENGLDSGPEDARVEEEMLRLKQALERKRIAVILVPSA